MGQIFFRSGRLKEELLFSSFFSIEKCVLSSSLRVYDMKTRKNEPQRPHTVTHHHLELSANPKQNCTEAPKLISVPMGENSVQCTVYVSQ